MPLFNWLYRYMAKFPNQKIKGDNEIIRYDDMLYDAEKEGKRLPSEKIGIYCKKELNAARAIMRCISAKATAVPLSPRYGKQHCQNIIEQIGLNYIITDDSGDIELYQTENKKSEKKQDVDLTDVALILCTSGTTGKPKGAMLTSHGIIANLIAIRSYFSLCSDDKILIARPLYHSAAIVGEFFTSLINGVEINFIDGNFNPTAILKRIISDRITVFCGTPTIFHHISHFAKRAGGVPLLRTVSVSGECLTYTVAKEMQEVFESADIYHVYGLTEAGPRVSFLPPDEFYMHSDSVGYTLPGIFAKITNKNGAELPRGQIGELLLLTPSAMAGYYNQSTETAKVFRNGWLHTGDVAKMDDEGRITILSRIDDMIIRGGINIYPKEIENAVCSIKGVQEAVVYGERDNRAGQKIKIKAVAPKANLSDIFRECQKILPSYQWPDSIELVDSLPRNSSGKIVRK